MIQKAHFILDVVWGCMRFILIYMCPISLVLRIWGYHKWVMLHTIGTQTNRLAPWYPICWLLITTIDPCWEWFRHTETKTYAHSLPQASHICPQWSVNRAPYIYIFPVNRNMSHLPLKCHLWPIHFQTRCAHRPTGHVLIAKVKELVEHAADVTRKNAAGSPNQGAFAIWGASTLAKTRRKISGCMVK